jgi:hypothetical protein
MSKIEEVRSFLDKAILAKGMTYRELSLRIGRRDSYLHRFIKYGLPRRLEEQDRKQLSLILEVDEQLLTDIDLSYSPAPAHMTGVAVVAEKITSLFTKGDEVVIDMIDATACCGDGIDNLPEKVCGHWRLPLSEFKTLASGAPENIKMLRVQGDSMTPTISEGDFVWVDTSNNYIGSDGIYLIRMATGLAVKRLQAGLSNIVIKSDNPTYSDITAEVGEVKIVGKVVHILNSRRV